MGKLSKKVGRQKKTNAEKEMSKKVALFGKLGEECLVCQKEFDKKDKEMVSSWYVIVRNDTKQVNLYCPPCWQRGNNLVKEIQEDLSDRAKK
jgi:hypothetical protein